MKKLVGHHEISEMTGSLLARIPYCGHEDLVPFGISYVEHGGYGVVPTVIMGSGQVGLFHYANQESSHSLGFFNTSKPYPIGKAIPDAEEDQAEDVTNPGLVLTFTNVESVDAVISVLTQLRGKFNGN